MKKLIFIYLIFCIVGCNSNEATNINSKNDSINIIKKNITDAFKNDSNNVEINVTSAKKYDSIGLYNEAIEMYDKLISNDNGNQDYWIEKGRLHSKNLDTPNAIKSFVIATKIFPKPIAMLELANLFAETKNAATIKVCEDLMSVNPEGNYNAKANYFIGKYYSNEGNISKSLFYLDKSLKSDFRFVESYIEKGYILFNQKKYVDALEIFEQLNNVHQKNADGYYWQAKCNEALDKKQVAIEFYNKSLKLDASIIEAVDALNRLSK